MCILSIHSEIGEIMSGRVCGPAGPLGIRLKLRLFPSPVESPHFDTWVREALGVPRNLCLFRAHASSPQAIWVYFLFPRA